MKQGERVSFIVPCHTSLMERFSFYAVWRINGTLYNERFLPAPFYQKKLGLLVRPNLNSAIGKTSLQCLLLSDVLLEDDYYYSDVGTLSVDKYPTCKETTIINDCT